jgi:quinoprotein glucose dehydrogenase
MTYEAGGKQYLATVDGGHGSFGTKLGDYVRAYALPDRSQ